MPGSSLLFRGRLNQYLLNAEVELIHQSSPTQIAGLVPLEERKRELEVLFQPGMLDCVVLDVVSWGSLSSLYEVNAVKNKCIGY